MLFNANNQYISAREFVDSWEKEIYELTNLDYFTYKIINEMGAALENYFYPTIGAEDVFYLNQNEIATLAFNIGDGLQNFFDKNCFGGCKLGCPNKLSRPFSEQDDLVRTKFVSENLDGITASCINREDCLYHDVLNYVVLDAILDFYNYEMGIILHEKDRRLTKLSLFVMELIINFTRKNGATLLAKPNELATELFVTMLEDDKPDKWEDKIPVDAELYEDEKAPWKQQTVTFRNIAENFEAANPDLLSTAFTQKLFSKFCIFFQEYIELNIDEEFDFEYIEEFFALIFPNDFILDSDVSFPEVEKLFKVFFAYLADEKVVDFYSNFALYANNDLKELQRTFLISQVFQKEKSYVDFLISGKNNNAHVIELFMEVTKLNNNEIEFFDLSLKTTHKNINVGVLRNMGLKENDIIHAYFDTSEQEWQLLFLEQLYPYFTKYFLIH